jgi:hypothetical protein
MVAPLSAVSVKNGRIEMRLSSVLSDRIVFTSDWDARHECPCSRCAGR